MLSQKRFTPGQRSSLFAVSLAATLVWTQAIADPAFALHNKSRAFSIVAADRTVPGAPDSFTCRFIENENGVAVYDYRCRNRDEGFERLLIGPNKSDEDEALLVTAASADAEETEVRSPGRFRCQHDGGPSRLPADFGCTDNTGRDFTLAEFAYVRHVNEQGVEDDPPLVYALPCRPCVELEE
jgi:hypothetical protein